MQESIPNYIFALREDLKLNKEFLPKQAEPDATGYDVRCASKEKVVLSNGQMFKIPLGFRVYCPDGWWLELNPRSSTFIKRELITLTGIIDQCFPGEVHIVGKFFSNEKEFIEIEVGDLIGQLIPVKLQKMNVDETTNENIEELFKNRNSVRKDGFGSTGVR